MKVMATMVMIMGEKLLMEMVIMIFQQDFNVDIQQSPDIIMLCQSDAYYNDDGDAQSQRW